MRDIPQSYTSSLARVTVSPTNGDTVTVGTDGIGGLSIVAAGTSDGVMNIGNAVSRQANLTLTRSMLPRVYANAAYSIDFGYATNNLDVTPLRVPTDVYDDTWGCVWVVYADDADGTNMSYEPLSTSTHYGLQLDTGSIYTVNNDGNTGHYVNADDYVWTPFGEGVRQPQDDYDNLLRGTSTPCACTVERPDEFRLYDFNTGLSATDDNEPLYIAMDIAWVPSTPGADIRITVKTNTGVTLIDEQTVTEDTDVLTNTTRFSAWDTLKWISLTVTSVESPGTLTLSDAIVAQSSTAVEWDVSGQDPEAERYAYVAFAPVTDTSVFDEETQTTVTTLAQLTTTPVFDGDDVSQYVALSFDNDDATVSVDRDVTQYAIYRYHGTVEYVQTTAWYPMGTYYTNDALCTETGSDQVNMTLYDKMYWLTGDINSSKLPKYDTLASVKTMVTTVIAGTGLTLGDPDELPDVSYNRYRPYGSIKQSIGQLAAAMFANAVISLDDETLRFVYPTSTKMTVGPADYDASNGGDLTISNNAPHYVNRLHLEYEESYNDKATQEEDPETGKMVTTYEEVEAKTIDLESLPAGELQDLSLDLDYMLFGDMGVVNADSSPNSKKLIQKDIDTLRDYGVSNDLFPFTSTSFSATLTGFTMLEPFDKIDVLDSYGTTHEDLVITSVTYTYSGGVTTTVSAEATVDDQSGTTSVATVATTVNTVGSKVLSLRNITVDTITGNNAIFNSMVATKLSSDEAFIKELVSSTITTDALSTGFLKVDAANMVDATITTLLGDTAVLDDLTITDGTVSGTLGAVKVTADNIQANTIRAEHIQVKGADGLWYALNANGTSTSVNDALAVAQGTAEYQAYLDAVATYDAYVAADTEEDEGGADEATADELSAAVDDALAAYHATPEYADVLRYGEGFDGSNIIAETITADKINVTDLSAFGATIGGWVVDSDSIHTVDADVPGDTGDGNSGGNHGTYLGKDGYVRLDATSERGVEFTANNAVVASIKRLEEEDGHLSASTAKLTIHNAEVKDMLQFGNFGWVVNPDNGHTSLKILNRE